MPFARLPAALLCTLLGATPVAASPATPSDAEEIPTGSADLAASAPSVLIGTYGRPDDLRALVRLANGRYVKLQVGDRLDGGRVSAIERDRLIYTKGDLDITLTLVGN